MEGKILIAVARFNDLATRAMLQGAEEYLYASGIGKDQVQVIWVPGAFELPVVTARAASSGKYQAVIALGCVIRGATPHFDYVAGEAAAGLMAVSISNKIPVIFGVLTTDTMEQALERCGLKGGNKGRDAAISALETLRALEQLD